MEFKIDKETLEYYTEHYDFSAEEVLEIAELINERNINVTEDNFYKILEETLEEESIIRENKKNENGMTSGDPYSYTDANVEISNIEEQQRTRDKAKYGI